VVRVRSRRVDWVDVKTGTPSGSLIEVFGDLSAGDEVATHGTDQLHPGATANARPTGTS
jgi:hypothetical protein